MGRVYSISISKKKQTLKKPLEQVVVDSLGIVGDGHAGPGNRQITLMNYQDFLELQRDKKLTLRPGDMAENVIIEGLDFSLCSPGKRIGLGPEVIVEIRQIGKEDHPSVVSKKFGASILPDKGLFCKVIQTGIMKVGDQVEIIKG